MPEQLVSPAGQLTRHWPLEHTVPDGQTIPHAPQLFGSCRRSTHWPLQAVSPVGQLVTHTPDLHASPAAQALPHVPQFAASVDRSMQEFVPQVTWGGGQETWQVPFAQT
jgi:hypothetical protein